MFSSKVLNNFGFSLEPLQSMRQTVSHSSVNMDKMSKIYLPFLSWWEYTSLILSYSVTDDFFHIKFLWQIYEKYKVR